MNYVHVTPYIYEHISVFTQLYNPKYTQPIKVYNSVLNKTIHLFKVRDHLYRNIHISTCYINTFPNEIGSGFNILHLKNFCQHIISHCQIVPWCERFNFKYYKHFCPFGQRGHPENCNTKAHH